MAGVNGAGDLLSGLPIWAQVAASLGMFAVAVIAAAVGFTRRMAPWMPGAAGSASASPSQRIDDAFAQLNATMSRIAGAAEGMHVVMQEEMREATIDREVKRRLEEHGIKLK
jgi:hypothetical protein